MRWFRKRTGFESLEHELRINRPEPPEALVRSISIRLAGQTQRHAPLLRGRVLLAAALSGTLVVVAGVLGGLSYAATATSHTASAVSHVFAPTKAHISNTAFNVGAGAKNNNRRGGDNPDGDDDPSHHQYITFVFVCLHVPPRHPFVNITLRLPQVAANNLIGHGLASPGPCS